MYPMKGGEAVDRESKWIRAVQKHGSKAAADALVRSYYDEIYVFAYRQTGCKEDAMDLTQGIFVAALRSLPRYDKRKASFRTWLYRIAAHKVIDARRRAHPGLVPLDDAEGAAEPGDFPDQVHNRALLDQIEAYISRFDPRAQAAFRLHLFGERTFPQIAAILEEPEAAVKSRYYRLLARIRKEFDLHG